jgi:hypothetical protein
MDLTDVAAARLQNERLIGAPFELCTDAVAWLGAVQAQDFGGAKWALGQRTRDCVDADVEGAFERGEILRTHILRPTWHFIAATDIRWMLALSAPRVHTANGYAYRRFELDGPTLAKSERAIAKALEGGVHLTRDELAEVLARAGVEARGPRLGYVMMHAELEALIVSGPRRGKQFTYALFDERVAPGPTLERDAALAELTRRYFTSRGPAQIKDYAWWSGLTMREAKLGVTMNAAHLARETLDERDYWHAPIAKRVKPRSPFAHLLPNYDEYLIAYKDHRAAFDPAVQRKLRGREMVLASHLALIDGLLVGGWRRTIEKDAHAIELSLLRTLDAAERRALDEAAERYARFVGVKVRMKNVGRARGSG